MSWCYGKYLAIQEEVEDDARYNNLLTKMKEKQKKREAAHEISPFYSRNYLNGVYKYRTAECERSSSKYTRII